MKKFKFIFTILIILFKTGNVLSDSSIFTVNNILVNKNAYNNKEVSSGTYFYTIEIGDYLLNGFVNVER